MEPEELKRRREALRYTQAPPHPPTLVDSRRRLGGQMSEKPSVSETAVARRFVLHVGPRLSGGVLRNFFRRDPTGLDSEAAPYEFALGSSSFPRRALAVL